MIEVLFKHSKQNGGTNFNRQYSKQNAVFSAKNTKINRRHFKQKRVFSQRLKKPKCNKQNAVFSQRYTFQPKILQTERRFQLALAMSTQENSQHNFTQRSSKHNGALGRIF